VQQVAKIALAAGAEDPRVALSAAAELRHAVGRLKAAVVRRARVAAGPGVRSPQYLGCPSTQCTESAGGRDDRSE
jgi:hypothetical protein